jgi:hypothetical protein
MGNFFSLNRSLFMRRAAVSSVAVVRAARNAVQKLDHRKAQNHWSGFFECAKLN